MPFDNRKFFRLAYPDAMMAVIVINGREYLVPEISEGGLRIRCNQFLEFRNGENVEATIYFQDGTEVPISGEISRRDSKDYVIAPLDGISFKLIVNEQRKLLQHYPFSRKPQ